MPEPRFPNAKAHTTKRSTNHTDIQVKQRYWLALGAYLVPNKANTTCILWLPFLIYWGADKLHYRFKNNEPTKASLTDGNGFSCMYWGGGKKKHENSLLEIPLFTNSGILFSLYL